MVSFFWCRMWKSINANFTLCPCSTKNFSIPINPHRSRNGTAFNNLMALTRYIMPIPLLCSFLYSPSTPRWRKYLTFFRPPTYILFLQQNLKNATKVSLVSHISQKGKKITFLYFINIRRVWEWISFSFFCREQFESALKSLEWFLKKERFASRRLDVWNWFCSPFAPPAFLTKATPWNFFRFSRTSTTHFSNIKRRYCFQ